MSTPIAKAQQKNIAIWLLACCFCIFLMVAIGGVTRLTQSGLSITSWQPISGVIPPMSQSAWQEEFSKYQLSPEYLKKNTGMSLEGFKGIFWLEFIHRLAGRLTGFIFLLPFIYFLVTKQISTSLGLKLLGIFALGGFQGIIGWYMVKSGLKDSPYVSQYWLAFHLSMAFLIYALVFRAALSYMLKSNPQDSLPHLPGRLLTSLSAPLIPLLFLQVIFGALVAGMHAGLIYNTFPDMDGQFIPPGMMVISPWYINFFENATTVQFIHRINAYLITILIIILWLISYKYSLTKRLKHAIDLLPIMVLVQLSLGVLTLLHHVPLLLASLHQLFALVLFSLVIFIRKDMENTV